MKKIHVHRLTLLFFSIVVTFSAMAPLSNVSAAEKKALTEESAQAFLDDFLQRGQRSLPELRFQ
ncbi:hypothetical protein G4V62_15680 [Bacillaceae bacterium SIJ1]|uniref:hypothetical protein n=1 Tax=Litoribacterium kuwaitense TaxID=1398745 RepID=UPI0013E9F55D|nr:hypothetical protein [Litoribacterium kuwaitense]NGP46313.1 hypothetical protein [Litoribacterium kuwaitense]